MVTKYKPDTFDIVVAVIAIPFLLAYRWWTFLVLWRWFAVPLGALSLTFGQVAGLFLIWDTLTFSFRKKDEPMKEASDWYAHLFGGAFVMTFALLLGLLVRGIFA
jgi:cytochrome bd-type quinol oxidase subunit 2